MTTTLEQFLERIDDDYDNFRFLANDSKILRLESCDFYLEETSDKKYQIQTSLKKILNPILILFYYNETPETILTEFYEATRTDKELEKGKQEDNLQNKKLREKDLEFKFGSVNLSYEKDLKNSLTSPNIPLGNPFRWMEIPEGQEYPFLVFYYQGLPQYIYEGIVRAGLLISEFQNWHHDLIEQEQENRDNKNKEFKDGYYKSVHSGFINYIDSENNFKKLEYLKGEYFHITYSDIGITFSKKDTEDVMIEYNEIESDSKSKFNQEIFDIRFRKVFPEEKTDKKDVFIDKEFLLENKEESKSFKNLFEANGMAKNKITNNDIDNKSLELEKREADIKKKEKTREEVKNLTKEAIKFLSDMKNQLLVMDVFSA